MDLANAQPIPNQLLEQPDFAVPAALAAEIDQLVTHYPKPRSAVLMLQELIRDELGVG